MVVLPWRCPVSSNLGKNHIRLSLDYLIGSTLEVFSVCSPFPKGNEQAKSNLQSKQVSFKDGVLKSSRKHVINSHRLWVWCAWRKNMAVIGDWRWALNHTSTVTFSNTQEDDWAIVAFHQSPEYLPLTLHPWSPRRAALERPFDQEESGEQDWRSTGQMMSSITNHSEFCRNTIFCLIDLLLRS